MKKRILLFSLGLILALFIGWQVYEYKASGGNTIFWLVNSTFKDSLFVEIYLDDKKLYSGNLQESWHLSASFSKITTLGRHKLVIKSKEIGITKEFIFYSLLVKWIHIIFSEDVTEPPQKKNKYEVRITTSSLPLGIE